MPLKNEATSPRVRRLNAPVRVELPSVAICLPDDAPGVARFAANELARLVQAMFGRPSATHPLGNVVRDGVQFKLAVATPTFAMNPFLAELQQPPLEEQEYLILPANDGSQSITIAGGSPAALLWAVYELAEFWGARFLLNGELLPQTNRAITLPESPIRRKPSIPLRAWRGINQLPHSGVHWGLTDYENLIDRLAAMRFNCFYVMLPPYGPFIDFEWSGLRKQTAELDFGWRFPIDSQTIGRERFNGSHWYENPDIPYNGSYPQKIAAATKLIDGIRRHAGARGMRFAVRFTFTEFPEEFKEHLRHLSLQDAFAPEPIKSGYVYRLGVSREGMDPTYSPFMSIRNPRFVDLAGSQLRAYLERYRDVDYLVLHPPEFANSGSDADFAWSQLAQKYALGPVENLQQLIRDAIEQIKNDPNAAGEQRLELQIRGHICSLYLLDQFLIQQDLAAIYRESSARLVVGVPFSSLAPLTARILGDNVELMQLLGSGYLASDAARHADDLKRPAGQTNPIHLTISIEDDNIGLTPQFTAPSLEKIMSAMKRHSVTGLWCRQWLLSKLEPAIFFASHFCWEESLTPFAAYTQLIDSVCGKQATGAVLKAFQLAEQITIENDVQGNVHSFLTPAMLTRFWDAGEPLKPSLLAMCPRYQQLEALLLEARAISKPEGRAYLDQFIGQCQFSDHWIRTMEKLSLAGQANIASQKAAQGGNIHEMDQQLLLSVKLLDESIQASHKALSAWAAAVRDRADLGALAALNQFGHRFLVSLRQVQASRADQWSVQF